MCLGPGLTLFALYLFIFIMNFVHLNLPLLKCYKVSTKFCSWDKSAGLVPFLPWPTYICLPSLELLRAMILVLENTLDVFRGKHKPEGKLSLLKN